MRHKRNRHRNDCGDARGTPEMLSHIAPDFPAPSNSRKILVEKGGRRALFAGFT